MLLGFLIWVVFDVCGGLLFEFGLVRVLIVLINGFVLGCCGF